MKTILYTVCIGSLALALTAGGAQAAKDKRTRESKAAAANSESSAGTSREHGQNHGRAS